MTSVPTAPPRPPAASPEREFTVRARSQREQIARRFLRNKAAMAGLIGYLLLVLAAFVGPHLYRHAYDDIDLAHLSTPPGAGGHPFGTGDLGRDLLAQLMRGLQRSTFICLIVVALSVSIGVLVGAVAGYYGRIVDNPIMRLVDLLFTLPGEIIIVVVAGSFPSIRTPLGIGVIIGAGAWLPLARIVRAQFLSLREKEFVEAAHALGGSGGRIIVKHLIPNALGQIIVFGTLVAATSVLAEAGLTFLGFGVQGSDTSLGRLVSDGVAAADSRPWLFYFPGLVLMLVVLSINLVGDGIRDAFHGSSARIRD